jgi:hypothetical protein
MKALTATVLLLALSAVAFAKPNPADRPRVAFVYADVNLGSVGAMHDNIGSVGAMRKPVSRFVLSLLVGRTGYVPHGSTLPLECQEG